MPHSIPKVHPRCPSQADPRRAPGSAAPSSDRSEAARLNALFAGAAEGGSGERGTAGRPVAAASAVDIAPSPVRPPDKDIAEPRGRAYLFRGVAGRIYSRGMDSLGDRI